MIMNLTAGVQRDLYTATDLRFKRAFDRVAPSTLYQRVCTIIRQQTKVTSFPFLHPLGSMVEWKDQRQSEKIEAEGWELEPRFWEKTLEYKQEDLTDENWPMIAAAAADLGNVAAKHPDQLLARILNDHILHYDGSGLDSTFPLAFTGKPLFATDHAWTTGTYTSNQSNIRTGTNTGKIDLTYGYDNIAGAIASMQGFRNSKNEIIGYTPDLLMVSSSLEINARRILNSAELMIAVGGTAASQVTVERGTMNPLRSYNLDLAVNPYLTAGYAVLFCTAFEQKPLIWLEAQAPKLDQLSEGTDYYNQRIIKQGVTSRDNIAPGIPFMAVAFRGD